MKIKKNGWFEFTKKGCNIWLNDKDFIFMSKQKMIYLAKQI